MTVAPLRSESIWERLTAARRRGLSDRSLAIVLVAPAAGLLIVLGLYPAIRAAIDGFFQIDFVSGSRTWVGLTNYVSVFTRPDIQQAFWLTLLFTSVNIVAQTGLGLGIALLLNAGLRGQTIARGLVLFPYMVPLAVVAMVFRFMFNSVYGVFDYVLMETHLISSPIPFLTDPHLVIWSLIGAHVWKYTPFMAIMFLARLQTVPRELYDAAAIDGAGHLAILRFVILPWLAPVIVIAMLMRTVWVATDFDLPYLLAFGGPLHASTLVPIEIHTLGFIELNLGQASALAVILGLILSGTMLLYLRYYRGREAQLN